MKSALRKAGSFLQESIKLCQGRGVLSSLQDLQGCVGFSRLRWSEKEINNELTLLMLWNYSAQPQVKPEAADQPLDAGWGESSRKTTENAVIQAVVSFLSGWEKTWRQRFGSVSSAPVRKKQVKVLQKKGSNWWGQIHRRLECSMQSVFH